MSTAIQNILSFVVLKHRKFIQKSNKNQTKIKQKSDAILDHFLTQFLVGFGTPNGFQNRPKEAQDEAKMLPKWAK